MPKIYEYLGLIFFFYSQEHLPIHVHVKYGEYESKIELIYQDAQLEKMIFKKVTGKLPIPVSKRKEIKVFVNQYHEGIVKKWTEYFVYNKKPENERVTKKIK